MGKLSKFNIPGQAHFVTARTISRQKFFANDKCCRILLEDINFYRRVFRFKLLGFCIMPDHFHVLIWWDGNNQQELRISHVIQSIKSHSAKDIIEYMWRGRRKPSLSPYSSADAASEGSPLPRNYQWVNRGALHTPVKNKIWQKSFYDFNIYSNGKFIEKLEYMHLNPVRAGLVRRAVDYPFSSARNYYIDDESLIRIDFFNP